MFDFLGTLSGYSILLPAVAFLYFKSSHLRGIWPFRLFILLSVVFEALFLYTSAHGIHNVQWSHVYAAGEFVTLFLFMRANLKPFLYQWLNWLAIGFTTYLVLNPFALEPWAGFNPIARALNSLVLMLLCLLYFLKIYREERMAQPEKQPEFWFVTGILFYFSASFFTFLLSSELLKLAPDKIETSWFFHSVSNILKNLLIVFGLWMGKK